MKNRGYYRNSLSAWRNEFMDKKRLAEARHKRMIKMKHPDADDQGILVCHLQQMIDLVETAQRVADALEPKPQTSQT